MAGSRSTTPGRGPARPGDAYPLHTATDTLAGSTFGSLPILTAVPSASRAGNILRLDVTPFSDSNGHTGEGFLYDSDRVTGSYQIDQDGKKISAGKAVPGLAGLRPPGPSASAGQAQPEAVAGHDRR